MPPSKQRQVHFNPTVVEIEEYVDDTRALNPRPGQEPLVLAPELVLHPSLRPGECPPLDLSLPSRIFATDVYSQLERIPLDAPACTPPLPEVHIRISAGTADARSPGLCTIQVVHNPRGEPTTVGDILTTVQEYLRQPESQLGAHSEQVDADATWYHERRLATVAARCTSLSAREQEEVEYNEATAGLRRVDRLQGRVLLAGITIPPGFGAGPHHWQLRLALSDRYASTHAAGRGLHE